MSDEFGVIVTGVSAILFSVFGWVIKSSSDKADLALSNSKENNQTIKNLNDRIDFNKIDQIHLDTEMTKKDVKDIRNAVQRLENHILKGK